MRHTNTPGNPTADDSPVATEAAPAPQPAQTGIDGVETQADAEARADEAEAVAAVAGHEAGDAAKPQAVAAATTNQPWPPTLPEQVRAVAQLLGASPSPVALPAIEASFKGKGPWKKGLPRILDTLEALGRSRNANPP